MLGRQPAYVTGLKKFKVGVGVSFSRAEALGSVRPSQPFQSPLLSDEVSDQFLLHRPNGEGDIF